MTPIDHPSQAELLNFAAGAHTQATRLAISDHVSVCADCRATVRALEEAGGAFLESLPEAPLSPDALDRALSAIDGPGVLGRLPKRRQPS